MELLEDADGAPFPGEVQDALTARLAELEVWMLMAEDTMDGYSGSFTEDKLFEDAGWFPSKEAAQAKIDELYESYHKAHEKEMNRRHAEDVRWLTRYEDDMRRWQILSEAGEKTERPVKPVTHTYETFAAWRQAQFNKGYLTLYTPTEITRGKLGKGR